jgi:hypothetical protein
MSVGDLELACEQTVTPLKLLALPDQSALRQAFVGKPVSLVRTPAIILDRSRFKANCEAMAATCAARNLTFRAHVKTHKTVDGIRRQLEAGQGCHAVVCSTMMECCQIEASGMVQEGLIKDVRRPEVTGLMTGAVWCPTRDRPTWGAAFAL